MLVNSMRIRIITINNLVFDLIVKGNNFDEIVNKIFQKKYIRVNNKTFLQTNSIAIIQHIYF